MIFVRRRIYVDCVFLTNCLRICAEKVVIFQNELTGEVVP